MEEQTDQITNITGAEGTSKRTRTMTDKGLEYAREVQEKELSRLTKQISKKSEQIEQLMSINAEQHIIRKEHSDWLLLFEDFLQRHDKYVSLLESDTEDKYEIEFMKITSFKGMIENWFSLQVQHTSREHSVIKPRDSISNISHSSRHSSRRSRGSSLRSSVLSAKLKEEQYMAELMAKTEALESKRQLEQVRLNLKLKEEELEIKTEMAIASARSKVLQKYDIEGPKEINEKETTISEHNKQLNRPVYLNPDSNPFIPKFVKSTCQPPYNSFIPQTHNTQPTNIANNDNQVIHSVVRQLRKPPPEIQKFSSDPLQYRKFMRQFEVLIVENSESTDELMLHLEQLTSGDANKIVNSYSYLDSKQGYSTVKAIFEERYGDPEVIANAFIKRAVNWPIIRADNPKALDDYSIFMAECENAVNSIHAMKILDYSENLKLMVAKLPFYLHDRWRSTVQHIKRSGQIVQFSHLARLIKDEAAKANDPVYGRSAMMIDTKQNQKSQKTYRPQSSSKGSYFVKDETPRKTSDQQQPIDNKTRRPSAFSSPCMFCNSLKHSLEQCDVISKQTLEEATSFLKSNRLCYGCLRYGHYKRDCRNRATCESCKKQHPTICHRDGFKLTQQTDSTSPAEASISVNSSTGAGIINDDIECTMAIVPVIVKLKDGLKTVHTHAFLDPGSSVTFISEDLIRQLGGHGTKLNITLNTMGQPYSMDTRIIKGLQVSNPQSSHMIDLPKAYTKDKLPVTTSLMPTQEDISQWPHLKDVSIPKVKAGVGLLIGNNVPNVYAPLDIRTGPPGSPHAVKSRIGWILWNVVRPNKRSSTENSQNGYFVNRVEVSAIQEIDELKRLDTLVRHSINMDFPEKTSDDKKEHSQHDKIFLQKVKHSMTLNNGHYFIDLPFLNENTLLPNNVTQAVQRLGGLERKLRKNDKLHEDYTTFMTTLVENGHAEKVPEEELQRKDGRVWYLPHHNVVHPRKPDKVRIVFDCAATFQGLSLNSQLLQGPDLTNYLIGVLLRFRIGQVAVMADIEAMFHQVYVTKKHTDCLRYLWWPNGDINQRPTTYRMLVHLFGATSSPSCANAALKQTALDNKDKFDQSITDVIQKNFYVDDCLVSVDNEHEATRIVKEVTNLCALGGFHLTKWTSSSPTVLQSIPPTERAKTVKTVNLDRKDLPMERALGVHWIMDSDNLGFKITQKDYSPTRRGILSAVSTIYDPLGIASPFVLVAKILLQQLCAKGLDWDTPIADSEQRKWNQWLDDIPKLENLQLQRCYKPKDFGDVKSRELHCFSDASEKGYGVSCYLRQENESGNVCCSLLLAKSRVAPLKKVTIPRMELTAATLSIRLNQLIQTELSITVDRSFYWTDSMPVINYIANDTTRFETFVANRLTVIRDSSSKNHWHYVPSNLNPADAASRGQPIKDLLQNKCWLNGPEFLYLPDTEWIQTKETTKEDFSKTGNDVTAAYVGEKPKCMERLVTRFSSWTKLKRITSRIMNLMDNLKRWANQSKEVNDRISSTVKDPTQKQYLVDKEIKQLRKCRQTEVYSPQILTADQLQKAEYSILRYIQKEHFDKEIQTLLKEERVDKSSPVYKLDSFLKDGLLRVGGRLTRADIPYESRHPVILPKTSPVSQLILAETHRTTGHLGRNSILAKVRENYWILGAGTLIKGIVSRCVHCRKYQSPRCSQKMADLPTERLHANTPPFTNVGMDYFGPFNIKRARSTVKRYGVIFTCLVTRAVHLEIAHTLDADSCLNAIRRFISRRGVPKVIMSDNGTNLVASERILREEINKLNQTNISDALAKENIHWKFNPPRASHFGGIWERIIRSVRKVMNAILHEQVIKLDDEGLCTLMCEIESILNGRPITELPNQPNDLEALTPNHLLMLKRGEDLPPGVFTKEDNFAQRRWRQVQFLADLFWRRWVKQYLPLLQERSKWQSSRKNISVGDVVLVVDDTPRQAWCLGRVLQTFMDKRGLIRSVQLKTQYRVLCRPIHKLCTLLEADIS